MCLLVPKTVLTFHCYCQMAVWQLVKGLPKSREKTPFRPRGGGQDLSKKPPLSGAWEALGWGRGWQAVEVHGVLAEAQEAWEEVRGLKAEGGERGWKVSGPLPNWTEGHIPGSPSPDASPLRGPL